MTPRESKPVRPGEEFIGFLLSEDDDLAAEEKLRYACAQVDVLKRKLAARDVTISRLRSQLPSAQGTLATLAIAAIHNWCESVDWMGYDVDCLREDLPRAVFQVLNPGKPWPPGS